MIKDLQSLRFIFVLLVFMSHITWTDTSFDFGGECGVAFFFILSGFVLSVGFGAKVETGMFRRRPFLIKQLLKFYPLHIIMMIVMLLMDMRIGMYTEPYLLLPNILLLQSWFPDDKFYFVANGSSWFLSDMMFFYLMFPLLYRKIMKDSINHVATMAIIVFLMWIALSFSVPENKINAILYASPMTRIIDFAVGILLYRVFTSDITDKISVCINGKSPLTAGFTELSAVIMMYLTYIAYQYMPANIRCSALFWFIIPAFIYIFVITDR
ncbi:acyltransferase [Prevotella sp. PCHR]|nr:acyltransferase [Xylanibacter caecicola]NPE24995.1 acyltransferase [Xylanibacter caecicola]